jgi:glycosyltransferase involved in cell wall biosynthesis
MTGALLKVVRVGYVYDAELGSPAALLDHYLTLTGCCEALVAEGFEPTVVQRFGRDAACTRRGVRYLFVSDRYGSRLRPWQVSREMHNAIAECSASVVHVDGTGFPVQLRHLRRVIRGQIPIVVQHHGGGPWNGLRGLAQRWGLHAASGFMFAARALADEWIHRGTIGPGQPVYEVMEGSSFFAPKDREQARTRTGLVGRPVFLWVGRLNSNKDPLTVLEGFERALDHMPDARLYMIYSADDLLEAVSTRLQRGPRLAATVSLLGRIPHRDLEDYYNSADYFVLGSHHEGSGYALAEALACGVVPIVTDIPSFRMMTADGTIGGLWAVEQPSDLEATIREVTRRPLPTERARARRLFEDNLSFPAIGRRTAEIYRALAEPHTASV